MADQPKLGHFLPYLLRRRLLSVIWPAAGEERAVSTLLLGMGLLYGGLFGAVCNSDMKMATLQRFLLGLNSILFISTLLIDFVPAFRAVQRPLPEHFPVSGRVNLVAAFLLDFISLRRLSLILGLLLALVIAQRLRLEIGLSLLLILSATAASFNLRLLLSLGRWRHPVVVLHLISLAVAGVWLALPNAPYHAALGGVMALVPWALWGVQFWWLGNMFNARYLVAAGAPDKPIRLLARLAPESKAYLLKAWMPLLVSLLLKLVLMGLCSEMELIKADGTMRTNGVFYVAFLPVLSFTYINNNLFGYLMPLVANEIQRIGLTLRVLKLYLRLALPVVLTDCLISAVLLLVLFPSSMWDMLWLLPLSVGALMSVGLWASFCHAKPVKKTKELSAMRNNTSQLMSAASVLLAAGLWFLPWWWVRVALVVLLMASVWPLVGRIRRNEGSLRRQLWSAIGA
ncbi:hypothetical protein SAMN00120144_1489 [Hymenobacter roseosalivarius DSM 11622]|uniref:Uncharacterized protein n=1 Tax=Hymenobacter roseosalivarius DSM 11622 TaxID=645990 RepID=A0A1W1V1F0_9BACT|nr:hypothetical protein [Hymenobacter roseosalivarius]SMB87150.1 hypothetical protein SAMN00120144_1489 [Hymenobacter roseosalivarius DSM 11622]